MEAELAQRVAALTKVQVELEPLFVLLKISTPPVLSIYSGAAGSSWAESTRPQLLFFI